MKKILLLFVLVLAVSKISFAQLSVYNTPLDSIEYLVNEYPEFLEELKAKISNIEEETVFEDLFFYYYGSAFIKSYSPYSESLQKEITKEAAENKDHKKVIELGKGIIESNPAILSAYLTVGNAYYYLNDSVMSDKYYARYYDLLSIPFYSGNGSSQDSAYVVRNVSDEYLIMEELGYSVGMQSLLNANDGTPFDVLEGKDEDGNEVKVYFNIYLPFTIGMRNMFSDIDFNKKPKKSKNKKNKKSKKNKK